jgi:hypothetical protein
MKVYYTILLIFQVRHSLNMFVYNIKQNEYIQFREGLRYLLDVTTGKDFFSVMKHSGLF